jgi:DNA ligase (NAD+)
VENEDFGERQKVRHPAPMLSTEKAYEPAALRRWFERVEKAAAELGIAEVRYRMTPKLDGLAGRDDGRVLATRGNGRLGYDISFAFERGVVPLGGRGLGLGEIVIARTPFEAHFSQHFDHPRNMAVGIISADQVSSEAQRALDMGIVHFVPYAFVDAWEGSKEQLLEDQDAIVERLRGSVDYMLDGMVAEALGDRLRVHMGATSHHYRWQIAIKERGETAETQVEGVVWQTGRTGNVTPVMQVHPTRISGATVRRITAHHAGLIRDQCIGPGARILITRSGEVIPKLEEVIETSEDVQLPTHCPSCEAELSWLRDFLRCTNHEMCFAQVVQRLRHWFRILETADWFGSKSLERIVAAGHRSLEAVYALEEADFLDMEFGPGQSRNFVKALATSRETVVDDARFLAAMGISNLGLGDSRNLLRHFSIEELGTLTVERLQSVKGFGEVTSRAIVEGLQERWSTIQHMLELGFRLERTPLDSERKAIESPIAGLGIVFTGKMSRGDRKDMEAQARDLGARVQSSVSKNTDLLVTGEKPGASKLKKAQALGTRRLEEADYLLLLGPS